MIVPVEYLDAVVAEMRLRGRDFDAQVLTTGEQLEIVTHFRAGFRAEQCAALLSGDLVRLPIADDGGDGEACA